MTLRHATITVRAPAILATLACGNPCTVEPRGPVTLTVTAPLAIRSRVASLRTTVNGTHSASANIALDNMDNVAGTISGSLSLTAPEVAPASWVFDVNVGGYVAETIFANIVAPRDGGIPDGP